MSVEFDLRAAILSSAPVLAAVSHRVAANVLPQDSALPYIALTTNKELQYGINNTVLAVGVNAAIQVWAYKAIDAEALADEVILALGDRGFWVTNRAGAYDEEMDLNAVVLTVEHWLDN